MTTTGGAEIITRRTEHALQSLHFILRSASQLSKISSKRVLSLGQIKKSYGDSLWSSGGPVCRTPGQGTKIPQAKRCSQFKKKKINPKVLWR